MSKTMDHRVGNVVELQQEEGCLCLQGLCSSATGCRHGSCNGSTGALACLCQHRPSAQTRCPSHSAGAPCLPTLGGSCKQLSQRPLPFEAVPAREVVLVYFTASHVLFFFIAGLLSSLEQCAASAFFGSAPSAQSETGLKVCQPETSLRPSPSSNSPPSLRPKCV